MSQEVKKTVGLTKDAGFQIGVRKTLSIPHDRLWEFFFSKEGIALWFGKVGGELPLKVPFKSREGFEGLITTFIEGSHLRMKWKKPEWENHSMLQVRIIPSGLKTVLSFHQDQLLNEKQRREMKDHWDNVIDKITTSLLL